MKFDDILDEIKPSQKERNRLQETYKEIRKKAEKISQKKQIPPKIELVGSSDRDTWLSGERDIDIFLLLPKSLDRESFEKIGLEIGKEIFPNGTVEYAEHPYVKGQKNGFEIDIVPCYHVNSASKAKSSVDRTPFHNKYIKNKDIDGDQVRLLKSFTKGVGIYGSKLKIQGFSGYLCELLILHYGGFREVIQEAIKWRPQIYLDIENHGDKKFDDPLIVVDPTDPSRNVAAVVKEESLAKFIDWCKRFDKNPRKKLFFPFTPEPTPMTKKDLNKKLKERDTNILCINFKAPDIVEDQLYPQLRKTENSLVQELQNKGFDIIRSEVMAENTCTILLELNIEKQSKVKKHIGPPVYIQDHAEKFKSKWEKKDTDKKTGIYIENNRYIVEKERKYTTAKEFIQEKILEIGLGKNVKEKLKENYTIFENQESAELLEEFGRQFSNYFNPLTSRITSPTSTSKNK